MIRNKLLVLVVAGFMLTMAFASMTGLAGPRGLPDNADSEPNASIADATNITSNSITIPGTLNGGDDADVYKIWLDNNGGNADSVSILADFNTSTGVSIEINDERDFNYYHGFDANADNKQLNIIGTVPQHFYINLSTQIGDASYSLTITKTNGAYSGNTNNDPTQAPTATGDNLPFTQNLDGDTPTDMQDFYKVSLTSSGAASDLLVAFMDQPDGATFWLELYKDAGGGVYEHKKMVKGVTAGADMVLSWGTSETGTYYLRVYAWSGAGQYSIYIQKTSINTDNDNSYDTATAITLTNHHTWTVDAELGESIDSEDWYSISIVEGQFINATINSLDYSSTTKLPMMYLQLLATNHASEYWDPNHTDSELDPLGYTNGTVSEISGTNYVKVYVLGGGGGGRYSIDLLTDKPPTVDQGQVGTIQVIENSVDTSVNLNDVFDDPDNDALVLTYEKGAGGTEGYDDDNNLSISIGVNGLVTITPKSGSPNGWTGSGPVTFTARDPYGLEATAEFTVRVKGTNHAPYILAPFDATLSFAEPVLLTYGEVENNGTIDLFDVFADNDTGDKLKFYIYTIEESYIVRDEPPIMGEKVLNAALINNSIRISFTKESNLIDHKGPINIYITDDAKNTKKDHDAMVWFTATDNGDPSLESSLIKLKIMIRSPGGNDPEWKTAFTKVQFDEDNSTIVDLDDHIKDLDPVDDGAIVYEITDYGTNVSVSQLDRSRFEFSALENWNGEVLGIKVKATDTFDLTAETTIKAIVDALDDPPVEDQGKTSPSPVGKTFIDEGSFREFKVGYEDPDGEAVVPIFEWYFDGELQPTLIEDNFNYTPDYDAAGEHTIMVVVKDDVNPTLKFNVTWQVEVTNKNRGPTNVKIITPEHNSTHKQGNKIEFKAQNAIDPDEDALVYTWYADGNPIPGGGNRTFEYKKLKPGEHIIKLEVEDGNGGVDTDEVTIKVKKKSGGTPGFEASLVLITMLVVGLLVLRKRR